MGYATPAPLPPAVLTTELALTQRQVELLRAGFISVTEARRIALHWTPSRPLSPARWTCSYCRGVRDGDDCTGCGAPRH